MQSNIKLKNLIDNSTLLYAVTGIAKIAILVKSSNILAQTSNIDFFIGD
ncbi:hypothetical protein [Actinobacillus ureae]|nr:hypothetical protein [Actinobacillus ureae]